VQVVRFASFAKEATQRRSRFGLTLLLLGAALFLAGQLYRPWVLYLSIGGFLIAAQSYHFFDRAISSWIGDRGENKLEEVLGELDDRFLLVRNWVPVVSPSKRPRGDIDFLLFGSFGVLVIEVKTYTVPTKAEGDRWYVQRQNGSWRPIKSPSRQLSGHVKDLSRQLRMNVHGLLVFNDKARLQISSPTVEIIRRKELIQSILALPDRGIDGERLWSQLELKNGKAA